MIDLSWNPADWEIMRQRLAGLSVEELLALSRAVGVHFTGNPATIEDRQGLPAKEQLLLVLDECEPGELVREYERLMALRHSSR
ncbi:MAG TPA: hypothetical protein VIR98_03745 [Candidatus Paceibacterota bacterium]|jgi:hypothetical protein